MGTRNPGCARPGAGVLPHGSAAKPSHALACRRAESRCSQLAGAGKVQAMCWNSRSDRPGYVTVYRVGFPLRERDQITRLNVAL
jgi:hypothetical protein